MPQRKFNLNGRLRDGVEDILLACFTVEDLIEFELVPLLGVVDYFSCNIVFGDFYDYT